MKHTFFFIKEIFWHLIDFIQIDIRIQLFIYVSATRLVRSPRVTGKSERAGHNSVALPTAAKQRGHQKRPCCRMKVSWSDWKVRQGRAYSVTLPPAYGRRQGYRIMPCPFGLSSHSRRPSQSIHIHQANQKNEGRRQSYNSQPQNYYTTCILYYSG